MKRMQFKFVLESCLKSASFFLFGFIHTYHMQSKNHELQISIQANSFKNDFINLVLYKQIFFRYMQLRKYI